MRVCLVGHNPNRKIWKVNLLHCACELKNGVVKWRTNNQPKTVDAALDRWHRKLNMCVNRINELRDKRKKLTKGYIKHPPPKGGAKVMLSTVNPADYDFDDVIPSFGSTPAIGG
jgi:hypothetical protein